MAYQHCAFAACPILAQELAARVPPPPSNRCVVGAAWRRDHRGAVERSQFRFCPSLRRQPSCLPTAPAAQFSAERALTDTRLHCRRAAAGRLGTQRRRPRLSRRTNTSAWPGAPGGDGNTGGRQRHRPRERSDGRQRDRAASWKHSRRQGRPHLGTLRQRRHDHRRNDCGACTAGVLEALRAIKAGPPLKNDVIVVFTDGEEIGASGALAFTRRHPWAADVGVNLVFEALGTAGNALLYIGDKQAGWYADQALSAMSRPTGYSLIHDLMWFAGNTGSDLDGFMANGSHGLAYVYLSLEGSPHLSHAERQPRQHESWHAAKPGRPDRGYEHGISAMPT